MIRMCGLRSFAAFLAAASIAFVATAQSSESAQSQRREFENTAQVLGILPELAQLEKLSASATPADRWQILWLRQQITEKIMAASLTLDASNARIDSEIARANEVRGYLADRRDKVVNRANLLGIITGGGLAAVSSGLEFSSKLNTAGSAVGLAGGLASLGFGLRGIYAQNGKTTRFDFDSNMLAEFFDRPTLPNSSYPPILWMLMNRPPRNGPADLTRKQQLLQLWVQVKRINSLDDTEKIDHVTSQPSQLLKLSIDDFEDRAAMLQDVRAKVAILKLDLVALLASFPALPPLAAELPCAVPKTGP